MPKNTKSPLLLGAAALLAVSPALPTAVAQAQQVLPAPYVSRAFDAVLLPVDTSVREAFDIDASVSGVLVLAVEPGGVADSNGVEPGDVISEIRGYQVVAPIDLDEVVYYWLINDVSDFGFDYYRAGTLQSADVVITLEFYETVVDVASVSSWSAWSYESFSYEEYSVEYSEEIVESYEYSETVIEETVTSEEYSEEVTEEYSEEVTEETTEEEITEETTEEEVTEEEVTEEEVTEEDAVEEEAAEEEVTEDDSSEEDVVEEEDTSADEAVEEESVDEGSAGSGGEGSGGSGGSE